MNMKVMGPADQGFGLDNTDFGAPHGRFADQREMGAGVDFGITPGANAQGVSFGGQSPQVSDSRVGASQSSGGSTDQDLASLVRSLVEQIMQALAQFMQQNQNDAGASSQGGGSPQGKSAAVGGPGQPMAANAASPGMAEPAAAAPAPMVASASTSPTDNLTAPKSAAAPESAARNAAVGDAASAGSGPYSLNITNSQDHAIKIGQFNQINDKETLVSEMTLEPGQKGTMKYEADTTGLLKQADADGNYQPDASRLEFFNGFVNTSDIAGRNAAIHVSDGKGFEVGDKQSIADKAPDSIISADSAGNETLAGWYDGSTEKMRQGGEFMTKELGTGMTYQHPDDDKLGEGNNPMRHTDSMSLDVVFGKA